VRKVIERDHLSAATAGPDLRQLIDDDVHKETMPSGVANSEWLVGWVERVFTRDTHQRAT
jgi:hypothetical protein